MSITHVIFEVDRGMLRFQYDLIDMWQSVKVLVQSNGAMRRKTLILNKVQRMRITSKLSTVAPEHVPIEKRIAENEVKKK